MARYQISSTAGADYGVWCGDTAAEALTALHRDAGYRDVQAVDGRIEWPDAETRDICGDVADWIVEEV